ncbi:hypothetical protein [Sphingomonas bacterium]|uniref:hypothetical protein n=1 Tax=Sphingomonas bacterium TaxID=1895847 RepID=UPI00262DE2F2|nr:hypothetical protein [Sphingomonas bacterium]MDB5677446.1 hypothetical protein [Sphingomonas bacterium]
MSAFHPKAVISFYRPGTNRISPTSTNSSSLHVALPVSEQITPPRLDPKGAISHLRPMLHGVHLENLARAFEAQYEPNEHGYLFRFNMSHAPVQVSVEERDAFVATFRRRMGRFAWAIIIGSMLAFGYWAFFRDEHMPQQIEWLVVGFAVAATGSFYVWAKGAPARALQRRPAVGPPRDPSEMRQVHLSRVSYPMLAAGMVGAAIMAVVALTADRPFEGINLGLLILGLVLGLILAVQLARKWRFAGENRR